MTLETDIAAMRAALAAGPTPGHPWQCIDATVYEVVDHHGTMVNRWFTLVQSCEQRHELSREEKKATARYIDACSPHALTRVLDALDEARRKVQELTDDRDSWVEQASARTADAVAAITERDEARRGSERLAGALQALLNLCTIDANSGDWGNWDPEEKAEVVEARATTTPKGPQ